MGGDIGVKRGKGFQEYAQRTHGQNQKRVQSRVESEDGWGWSKMDTTVLEQQ